MTNKVILITGASSGIGAGIARELAKTDAVLLLGARREDRINAIPFFQCEGGKRLHGSTVGHVQLFNCHLSTVET